MDTAERLMFASFRNPEVFGPLLGGDYITINADGVMENKVQTLDRRSA